jgi:drug/metabolite transporter (DMT)-like permease
VPSSNPFTRRPVVLLLATLSCLLWGSAYPAIKHGYALLGIGTEDVGSQLVFAGIRFALAGLVLLAGLALRGTAPVYASLRAEAGPLVLLGLTLTGLHYLFFYVGLAHTTGVKGSIVVGSSTFFSVLLAHFLYANDRLSRRRITGVVTGFAGVVWVNFRGAGLDLDFTLRGEGFVAIAAFLLSAASIYGKRLSQRMNVIAMTGHQLTIGGLALLGTGFALGGSPGTLSPGAVLLLAYMVLLSSVAFALWSLLLKHNRVGSVAVYSFLIPVFGALLSALFLGERILDLRHLAALALVCAGIWIVHREPAPREQSPNPAG